MDEGLAGFPIVFIAFLYLQCDTLAAISLNLKLLYLISV